MTAWDQDYIDEEEESFFEFDEKGGGEFHFGYVHGNMDCRGPRGTVSQPSNGHGTATTKGTRRRAEAGRWSRMTNCMA